jgi:hypothetical protein
VHGGCGMEIKAEEGLGREVLNRKWRQLLSKPKGFF